MNTFKRYFLAAILLCVVAFAGLAKATDFSFRLFDSQVMTSSIGTASLNSATATYTNWQPLITITPVPGQALQDLRIVIDLDQASTGVATQLTSQTLQFTTFRKIDGTNTRYANNLATTALSGTNSSKQSIELIGGLAGPTETVGLAVKASSMTGLAVATIPYVIYYRSQSRVTVTAAQ